MLSPTTAPCRARALLPVQTGCEEVLGSLCSGEPTRYVTRCYPMNTTNHENPHRMKFNSCSTRKKPYPTPSNPIHRCEPLSRRVNAGS